MFLIKGEDKNKDIITTLLLSVNMNKEVFLYLFDHYLLGDVDFKKINTINLLSGYSKRILTDKSNLMEWFHKINFSASIRSIVFSKYNETDIKNFLERGPKHKFLKPSDGFAGKDIIVIDSAEEVKKYLENKEAKRWVLQDALEDIATFHRFKFHLRVIIIVVVRDKNVSIYISNFHQYVLSTDMYNVRRLKEPEIYDTHKKRNSRIAFFPMELPDRWTPTDTKKAMVQITRDFFSIFKQQHSFIPDWKVKNGFEILGADVIFNTNGKPYILEINTKMSIFPSQLLFFPEILHLGLGGAPLKLFSTLYGTPEGRITPFTKPLTTFYETIYKNALEINDAFKSIFHISLEEEADKSYFEYQKTVKTRQEQQEQQKFLVQGTYSAKEQIISILSSVNLKDEAMLLLFDNWYDSILDLNIRDFHTINRSKGNSKDILTNKYELMQYFSKTKFPHSLPCITFSSYDDSLTHDFFSHGSRHKFLKASDGFSGSGITVVDSIEEVKKFIEMYKPTGKFKGWILQDALEDIATFQGYKFHLRLWIVIVIRNGVISIYINNYYFFVLSKKPYDKTKLKDEDIYNTHEYRNSKNNFFPMELPDDWTAADAQNAIKEINKTFTSIFKHQHDFLPDWKVKNGFEILGADIVFDTKHKMYILEINSKTGMTQSYVTLLPEVFHLGLGGAPLKLFSTLYGTPEGRSTPFTKPLQTFYETKYTSALEANQAFYKQFNTNLQEEADQAYMIYQSYTPIIARHTRKKHRTR